MKKIKFQDNNNKYIIKQTKINTKKMNSNKQKKSKNNIMIRLFRN